MSGNDEKITPYAPDCKYCSFVPEGQDEPDDCLMCHCYILRDILENEIGYLNAKGAVQDPSRPRKPVQFKYKLEGEEIKGILEAIKDVECNQCSKKMGLELLELTKQLIAMGEYEFGDD